MPASYENFADKVKENCIDSLDHLIGPHVLEVREHLLISVLISLPLQPLKLTVIQYQRLRRSHPILGLGGAAARKNIKKAINH